ncbi:hypothetical protein MMC30_004023 [Trapelia coarctata]|nr:hypothetical protein [Trapelia coarctata]
MSSNNQTLSPVPSSAPLRSLFQFLLLPREIRDLIYKHVLTSSSDTVVWPPNSLFTSQDIGIGLLATCRQINEEGTPVLYACNTFLINITFTSTTPSAETSLEHIRQRIQHAFLALEDPWLVPVGEYGYLHTHPSSPAKMSALKTLRVGRHITQFCNTESGFQIFDGVFEEIRKSVREGCVVTYGAETEAEKEYLRSCWRSWIHQANVKSARQLIIRAGW